MSQQLKTQVDNLINDLNDASNGPCSEELNNLLDQAIRIMQDIQDDVSNAAEADIIVGLTANNKALGELNKAIDAYSKTLDASAVKIKSIADKLGAIVGIVTGIVSSGVL